MNHFIILYNVFGDATTPLLFYKLDKDLWSILKHLWCNLERLPEFPITALHDIPVDEKCLQLLNDLWPTVTCKNYWYVHKLQEEMVANNVSGGQIAGTADAGDDPPVRKKKPPITSKR